MQMRAKEYERKPIRSSSSWTKASRGIECIKWKPVGGCFAYGQPGDCMCVLIYRCKNYWRVNPVHAWARSACNVTNAAVCSLYKVHRIVSPIFFFFRSRVDWNLSRGPEQKKKKKYQTKFDARQRVCVCGNYKVAYSGHNTQLGNEFDHLDAAAAAAAALWFRCVRKMIIILCQTHRCIVPN